MRIFVAMCMKNLVTLLLIGALALPAQASPDAAFADWNKLVGTLQRYGIAAHEVNWAAIEPMCLSLKTPYDQTEYNRCKFERAREQRVYQADYYACRTQAKGHYPRYLARRDLVETRIMGDSNGYGRITQTIAEPIRGRELNELRAGGISACMQNLGWASPNDWRLGLR